MSNVAKQIADIERELLALTGNQPPNPNQMPLYTVTASTSSDPQLFTIVFDDSIIRLTKAFAEPGGQANIGFESGDLKVLVGGSVPTDFTVVSMGAFTLV